MRSLLIITGTMGAGKTSVLGEASDILARRQVGHAAIDVDALGLSYLPTTTRNDEAMYGNLLARALENYYELDMCRGSVFATNTTVCRLTANIGTMERRVTVRESGLSQREYVSRVAELNAILDKSRTTAFHGTPGYRIYRD